MQQSDYFGSAIGLSIVHWIFERHQFANNASALLTGHPNSVSRLRFMDRIPNPALVDYYGPGAELRQNFQRTARCEADDLGQSIGNQAT